MTRAGTSRLLNFRPGPALGRNLLIAGLLILVAYPLVMVVASVFFAEAWGARPLSFADLQTDRVLRAWSNTFVLGGLVTVLSILFGLAGALLAHRSRWARFIDGLMAVPFLTPPFLVSLAWSQMVGSRGYASRLGLDGLLIQDAIYSLGGMAVLMATSYAPLVYSALRAQLARLPGGLVWAAAVAGAGRIRRLISVVLPLLLPAIAAGGFLAFASAIGEYGTPLVIGQRIGYPVIATEIGRLVSVFPIDLSLASALGSTLLFVGMLFYFVSRIAGDRDLGASSRGFSASPALLGLTGKIIATVFMSLFALTGVIAPMASLLVTSTMRLISQGPRLSNVTFDHYRMLLEANSPGFQALLNSLGLALGAAVLGLIIGLLAARAGRFAMLLATIPVAVPAITTAVGFIRGWNAPWAASLPVYGTGTILLLFYLAQYLPYVVQYVAAGQSGLSRNLELAARVHGANQFRNLLHIALPLLWPHALAGAIMIFSIAFRELVGSVLLRPPSVQTTATYIMQQFDQGSVAAGTAMGVIAVLAALISTVTARWFAARSV